MEMQIEIAGEYVPLLEISCDFSVFEFSFFLYMVAFVRNRGAARYPAKFISGNGFYDTV